MITEIDVRSIPPGQRHPLIFRTFDALANGSTLQLISDHEPRPLFYMFQAERSSQFQWDYVEQGPAVWRVNITKTA